MRRRDQTPFYDIWAPFVLVRVLDLLYSQNDSWMVEYHNDPYQQSNRYKFRDRVEMANKNVLKIIESDNFKEFFTRITINVEFFFSNFFFQIFFFKIFFLEGIL